MNFFLRLIDHNVDAANSGSFSRMWHPIGTEDYDEQLELAVIVDGVVQWHSAPCRRVIGGWVRCDTHEYVTRMPTHWRPSAQPHPLRPGGGPARVGGDAS
ncbi:MAG: hypothetical protein HZA66_01415 [Rhodopseudomonas palustris]|uniref:Uncharacterized protein n=1 Tax=Rhodopseudomonas palustris TaxID=1076 RepID=A0A933VZQ1_RHOPL|nr:hypothetical protein [Rhodopseudomonas palustris]